MKRLSEELLEYFSNTPEEQLQKDWEAIHSKYAYGPEINQFIEECEKNALHNEIVDGIYGSHPTSRVNVESPISQDFGDWIEALPTKSISMATLANSYRIIGL